MNRRVYYALCKVAAEAEAAAAEDPSDMPVAENPRNGSKRNIKNFHRFRNPTGPVMVGKRIGGDMVYTTPEISAQLNSLRNARMRKAAADPQDEEEVAHEDNGGLSNAKMTALGGAAGAGVGAYRNRTAIAGMYRSLRNDPSAAHGSYDIAKANVRDVMRRPGAYAKGALARPMMHSGVKLQNMADRLGANSHIGQGLSDAAGRISSKGAEYMAQRPVGPTTAATPAANKFYRRAKGAIKGVGLGALGGAAAGYAASKILNSVAAKRNY